MFTVDRKTLSAELTLLQSVAEKKGTQPILSNVLFDFDGSVLTLTASSLDVTLISKIDARGEPFRACIPLAQLSQLSKLLNGEEVSFSLKSQGDVIARVEVTCTKSRHKLPYLSRDLFPETPQVVSEMLTINGNTLAEMVKATRHWVLPYHAGISGTDLKYTGLSIRANGKTLELMSSTRKCAAIATIELSGAEAHAIVNQDGLTALASLGESVGFASTANHAFFMAENRTLITRQIEGKFPEAHLFMPKFQHKVEIPDEIVGMIKRANVTTDGREVLKLTIAKDSLTVESRDNQYGAGEESVPTTSTLNGESISYAIVPHQLLTALSGSFRVTCEFVDAKTAFAFKPTTKDFELSYVLMPARLDW
jgi:DNA polymerase-3 subunit beta